MERTLTLPAEWAITARGFTLPLAAESLSDAVLAQAIEHGLRQTIADAASAAASGWYETQREDDTPDWKQLDAKAKSAWVADNAGAIADYGKVLMEKRIAALQAGDWTTRSPAVAGMSEVEAMAVKVADEAFSPAKWKGHIPAWDALGAAQRRKAKLDVLQASPNWSRFEKAAERRIEEERGLQLDI